MRKTSIEYGQRHWPIITGCAQPPSVCATQDKCWARALHKRFGEQWANLYNPDFSPRFNLQLLYAPSLLREAARILVAFTGDMFGPKTKADDIWQVLQEVAATPRHIYLFLTKSPENLAQFNPWPDNAWVGATAIDNASVKWALANLALVNAKVIWLSLEPLLGRINMLNLPVEHTGFPLWLVVGAQTGREAFKPKLSWVQEITEAADGARVKLWLKNNLLALYPELPHRQELP